MREEISNGTLNLAKLVIVHAKTKKLLKEIPLDEFAYGFYQTSHPPPPPHSTMKGIFLHVFFRNSRLTINIATGATVASLALPKKLIDSGRIIKVERFGGANSNTAVVFTSTNYCFVIYDDCTAKLLPINPSVYLKSFDYFGLDRTIIPLIVHSHICFYDLATFQCKKLCLLPIEVIINDFTDSKE